MKDLVFESIKLLPEQCSQALNETKEIYFPKGYKKAKNIVIAGMGGSAYSYYVIKSLFEKELETPLILANGYHLPGFVDKSTLVIASSYSGNTEETLSCASEGLKKGTRLTAVTSGGKLERLMKENKLPFYIFDPKYNPSGQPRMGQGYMIGGTISLIFKALGQRLEENEFIQSLTSLKKIQKKLEQSAEEMAVRLKNKIIVFVAAEHLSGNAHILRNQTNETAKNFAAYSLIPELNHHLMEGLRNPKRKNLVFLFLNSKLYSERIRKRVRLTMEVVKKNEIEVGEYMARNRVSLVEVIEVLMFGGYLTYYLAQEYKVDPRKIPWVDWFKKKLASS